MNAREVFTFTAACLIYSSGAALAQAPHMKMTTDIPSSLVTPNTVETRIGTLKFTDGFPDDATAAKVYDNLDFQRGVQAYLTALPAVSIEALRKGLSDFGPVNQTVLISEQLLDARSLFLTANTTTPYTLLYLNAKDGPLVVESLRRSSVRSMMLGSDGSPTLGLQDLTKASVENTYYCLLATKVQSLRVTLLLVHAPSETCSFSEPS
jgi:hypothetical protein